MKSLSDKEKANLNLKVLQCCNLAFYLYDFSKSRLIWTNGGYPGILGYKNNEVDLSSMDFSPKHYHPEDASIIEEKIEVFKKGGVIWAGVYRLKHKKGHWVWVYSKVNVFEKDKSGRPKVIAGVIIEASAQLNTGKQLNILYKEGMRYRSQLLIDKLTRREKDILVMIASGKSYTEIAKIAHIQPDTVNKHRKNILRKLNLKNISQLSCFATETGIK